MNFIKRSTSFLILLTVTLLSGCYKKDLEEFKKVNTIRYEPELALPFSEKSIMLKDTIPTIPSFTTITMSDTSSIEIPASDSKDTLESIVDRVDLKVKLENTFPFNGIVQVYFADSNNVFVDSLLSNVDRIIPAGNPTLVKYIEISVDRARYINISKKTSKMFLYYRISTSTISGLSDKYLKINIGLKTKLSIDLNN